MKPEQLDYAIAALGEPETARGWRDLARRLGGKFIEGNSKWPHSVVFRENSVWDDFLGVWVGPTGPTGLAALPWYSSFLATELAWRASHWPDEQLAEMLRGKLK